MAGLNGITAPNGSNSSGVGLDNPKLTGHLKSAHVGSESSNKNLVVPDSVKKKAESLLESLPSTIKPGVQEQGHGTDSAALADFDAKQKKYEADVAARNSILSENAKIRGENAGITGLIDETDRAIRDLDALMAHVDFRDCHFSKGELVNLAAKSTTVREAAQWLLTKWEQLPKNVFGDLSAEALLGYQAMLRNAKGDLQKRLKPELAVPPEPTQPVSPGVKPPSTPPPPGQPASTSQASTGATNSSGTNSSTGSNGSPATGSTSGTNNAAGSGQTGATAGTSATANLDAVPAFTSTGTTGEARLLDGIDHCQAQLDALEKDITACKDNPAQMQALNNKYTKLQTAQSMLMQLLKQRTEMMNNIQKMYSEMAMSAVRNMR